MINYNVPLNKKHINANIEIKILEDNKMRKLGFTDYCKTIWTYREVVFIDGDFVVTFNLSIKKDNPKNFDIDILDESWCQPYDYQKYLKTSPNFKTALDIHNKVQTIMKKLIDNDIIKGYNLGDYI